MKKLTILLLTTFLISFSTAHDIQLTADQYRFNLVGGDNASQEIHISWNGDYPIYVKLEKAVSPTYTNNTEGINVTYTPGGEIQLLPGETQVVHSKITTSVALKEDEYIIYTEVQYLRNGTIQKDRKEKKSGGGSLPTSGNQTNQTENDTISEPPINETQPPENVTQPPQNQTGNRTEQPPGDEDVVLSTLIERFVKDNPYKTGAGLILVLVVGYIKRQEIIELGEGFYETMKESYHLFRE